jgi:hypothetical protein
VDKWASSLATNAKTLKTQRSCGNYETLGFVVYTRVSENYDEMILGLISLHPSFYSVLTDTKTARLVSATSCSPIS